MTRGTRGARTTAVGAALATALLLTGCTGAGGAAPATPSASAGGRTPTAGPSSVAPGTAAGSGPGSAAPTPRPTSTVTAVPGVDHDGGAVPATCGGLLTAGRWTFATAPLNDPAVVGDPVEFPKSVFDPVLQPDGKRLYCVWRDPRADITNVAIEVDVIDSSKGSSVLQGLDGYTCAHDAEGHRCQEVTTDPQYGVPVGSTYFTRGDIGIHISQANVPTSGLLDDVMAHVF